MTLASTGDAIGAVTRRLSTRLTTSLPGLGEVTVGRPSVPRPAGATRLNLFLYEVSFDAHLKNIPLEEDGPPPLWLALRYLLTAYDDLGESDSEEAHDWLGRAIRSVQAVNFDNGGSSNKDALGDSPDLLKVTFDEANPELLSRLMQGPNDRFRCSVAFQIRPVMIAPPEPPRSALLVGMDYTTNAAIAPEQAVGLTVVPSLGPLLESVEPSTFEAGDRLVVRGSDLVAINVAIELNGFAIAVTERHDDRLVVTVPASFNDGTSTSAGTWPLKAVRLLAGGRRRTSQPLLAGLRPIVAGVTLGPILPLNGIQHQTLDVTGRLLGTGRDEVVGTLLRDGRTLGPFDLIEDPAVLPPVAQSRRLLHVPIVPPIPAGAYRLIYRVNGQQARASPVVNMP